MQNEKALAAFVGNIAQIRSQLDELQEYIGNHMDTNPDEINWGDAGTAEKVSADLNNILLFLGLRQEAE